jgi:ParB-like nuclease domain
MTRLKTSPINESAFSDAMGDLKTIDTSSIVYRQDLYPRFKPNPSKIQEYADNIERLPPIELNQDNILIDGYHRWKAYETAKLSQIPYFITETKSERELEIFAVQRNSTHGQQLTQEEKRSCALKWYGVIPEDDIKTALSISRSSFDRWTKNKREDQEAQVKQRVYNLWLACETHDRISKITKIPRQTVTRIIADLAQNTQLSKMSNFRDFEQEDSHLKYKYWWDF